jgi:uncharacterized protein (TIRG00374 family)
MVWLVVATAAVLIVVVGVVAVPSSRRARVQPAALTRVSQYLGRLRVVRLSPTDWVVGCLLAAMTLFADCACLGFSFLAVGQPVPWRGLLPAYAVGQLASRLPMTPGGLGLVEGGLVGTLALYGTPAASSVGAVLVYRFISYWGLTGIGWPAVVGVSRERRSGSGEPVGSVP